MRRAGRAFLRAVVVSLVAVVVGPVGTAMATLPIVTIESPANGSVTNNPTPSFNGTAEAASGEVTLTIYEGPTAIQALKTSALSGAWSVPTEPLNPGTYTAKATQTNLTSETGTSEPVTFTVEPTPCAAAPSITGQPTDQTVTAPAEATFSAAGSTPVNCGPPTVQWFSEAPGASSFSPIGGATLASYTTSATTTAENGTKYMAVFTNSFGPGESNAATLTVEAPPCSAKPAIIGQPQSETVTAPGAATFNASASTPVNCGPPTIQWQVSTDHGSSWSNVSTSQTLSINPTSTSESGHEFRAVFTNEAGSTESNAVTLTVNPARPTVTSIEPSSGPAAGGASVKIKGSGFLAGATVTIGSAATSVVVVSKEEITAKTVATAAGPDEVIVSDAGGASTSGPSYTYIPAPTVTLNAPAPLSNNTTPSFTGTASDTTPVVVHIYNSAHSEVSSAKAGTGGSWTSSKASPELSSGAYTAVATQASSLLGNPAGTSNSVTFTVETAAPTVTLNQPTSPSNNTRPFFTGFASDTTPVVVHIYNSAHSEVSSATAAAGGIWISAEAIPALSSGQYTAVATQASSLLGNPEGTSNSVTFTVETAAPTVTLKGLALSNNTTPSFTGTATDTTPIVVHIYNSAHSEVSSATATGTGGGWSSGKASPGLASGEYTATATQESSLLGNPTGVSAPVTFTVDTTSPTVTLAQPVSLSNNTKPSFTGTATDTTRVTVKIYAGATAKGTVVRTATATGTGGTWTSAEVSPALPDGEYTATATQESPLGNPAGVSPSVTFTVDTAAPKVTLNSPALVSNNTTPSFTGTATDTTPVTVKIYAGATAKGTVIRTVTATGTGGSWTSTEVSPALPDGEYTATATQESSLKNPAGVSSPVTFKVNTTSPTVTLSPLVSPSNTTKPSFTGNASDTTPVTVQIYSGATPKGTVIRTVTATGTGGSWTSTEVSPALPDGEYTATATQESSLKNPAGVSAPVTFKVDTTSPKVTLSPLASPSKNATPAFTGTASDSTPVAIQIYAGATAKGSVVSTATATATGGSWTSGGASPALSSGEYTATATQESSLKNPAGVSPPVTFKVDTTSPKVTLNPLVSPSKNTVPSFAGTASDTTPVTVKIYEGATTAGPEVSTAKETTRTGGGWTSGGASPGLSSGKHTYTAIASQASSLGNPAGVSAPVTFTVDTTSPTVTLSQPASPSSNITPSFTGTASDTTSVTVQIYLGAPKKLVATIAVTPVGGSWTATSPALSSGKHTYTAVATQTSSLGNPAGTSSEVTFIVDTLAPTLNLNAPAAWLDSATPSFTGTTNEASNVVVEIYAGAVVKGFAVSTATATGAASWTSGGASPALPDGEYTAMAAQTSIFGDLAHTKPVTFRVDTIPPHVTLTLTPPASGSTSQTVNGTAGDPVDNLPSPSVTAQLFSGSTIVEGQAPLQSITVSASGGVWSATFGGLSPGTYTARAKQSDQAGNVGLSPLTTFVVVGAGSAVAAQASPAASFTWFPAAPHTGEPVSLASSSTDASSPITAFVWDLAGSGTFAAGGQAISTSFSTPGNHVVRLRVTDANGHTSVATETIAVTSAPVTLMQPFPVVRIASTDTASGVSLTMLRVQASAGARITVACKGRGCPVKSQSRVAAAGKLGPAPVDFRRFERSLRAGVILEIRVSKPGEIGKYTRFTVRHGKLPVRVDTCLGPAGVKPMSCPSS
jgi:large repetitive protein